MVNTNTLYAIKNPRGFSTKLIIKKIVNFHDVTLDLKKGTHQPYLKANNNPLYVHNESNHPPSILKNIPLAINKRLNELSSNKDSFDEIAAE